MNKNLKVLVSDPLDKTGLEILSSFANVDVKLKLNEDELISIIKDYDALVVRSGTKVTGRIIEAGVKLQIIGRAGVGVDNVDVRTATSCGIYVVNSPQGNTVAAAEHTLGLMLSLARHIPQSDASMRRGEWLREKYMGVELNQKILGIIGLGQVGSHLAKICREIGMQLITYDPYINANKAKEIGCKIVSLDNLLKESDFITLHIPLSPQTKYLINKETLKLIKPTAKIINCSRGGIIDEEALFDALSNGGLAGAALDVFEREEKINLNNRILNTPNLIFTPHLGASTAEAQTLVAIDVAKQIKQVLEGNLPSSPVNMAGIRFSELKKLRFLLECCETLGRLAVQLLKCPLENISVIAHGEFGDIENSDALLLSVANGALSVFSSTRVNFVNVRTTAEKQKIKLSFTRNPHATKSGISVELTGKKYSTIVHGTVTEDNDVLLKALDSVPVYIILPSLSNRQEFVSDTNLQESSSDENSRDISNNKCLGEIKPVHFILSKHEDQAGALAQIATALSNAGVNIANCHIGRTKNNNVQGTPSTEAIAIFHTDGNVTTEVLQDVRKISCVKDCISFTL